MREKLNRILEYEKRLIQDRQQLMELMSEAPEDNEELVRYKLECFQKEIAFMNRQVELLKEEARTQQVARNTQAVENTKVDRQVQNSQEQTEQELEPARIAQGAGVMQKPKEQTPKESSGEAMMRSQAAHMTGFEQSMQETQAKRPAKKDLEKTVGKSLMGIFASVLIFISLILFATLLLPYFTDTLKMLTTYVVSFTFLGIGLSKMKKDKTNKFYVALTGCGIGALYISLLLSNIYFKVLGDIPLYVLICVWGIGVCLFAKQKSTIFRIIGELGITIAVIFGCVLCMNNEDAAKMLALIIFYTISSAVFYFVHFEREFFDNLVHHISNVINVYMLTASTFVIVGHGLNHFEAWLMLVIVFISLGSTLWHSLEKESISFGAFATAYAFTLYQMLEEMLVDSMVFSIVTYVVMVILLVLYEWKHASRREGKYIVQTFLLIMATAAVMREGDLYYYGMVPLLILPALLYGFFRRNQVCKYGSLVMLFLYTFETHAYTQIPHFLLGCVAIITGFGLIMWKREQYSRIFKYSLHVLTLLFLVVCVSDMAVELGTVQWRKGDGPGICNYMLFTLFNIGMMKSFFGKNLATGENENQAVYNIANMLSMLFGTIMIASVENGLWHILLILTVLGAFMINSKRFLDKRESLVPGIYVGVKFTILMIVILESFDSANYVVSIACLLLAITGIVLGFVAEYKSLRIFGLLLSMISIFKLIMVDIRYDNTLGHALSFFGSGILCFVISLIYNYIDKRFSERA